MNLPLLSLLVCAPLAAYPQDQHHSGVNQRGDHVMGFSHDKTTHHFTLHPDGGVIEVQAKDLKDDASRDQIRTHLRHIAEMFADGDFSAPMLIHDRNVPGAATLTRLKEQVRYNFEPTPRGARILITTSSRDGIDAVHEFLRFQIVDHQTGDPVDVR